MMADGLIANSRQVASWLQIQSSVHDSDQKLSVFDEEAGFKDCGEGAESAVGVMGMVGGKPLFHVINTVEMERLIELPLLDPKGKPHKGQLVVGMLSSNLPKKGLDDVAQIAHHLEELDAPIVFVLYGPLTPSLQAVLKTQSTRGRTPRIRFGGYVQDPAMALAKVDVLINVSRFQESFGRTALEAMAAARPVVGYAWGALPELVIHGQTGFLEAFGDTQAVAKRLLLLHQQPDLLLTMGQAGRQHALDTYSLSRLCEQLARAYESFG
jgi:glycosyltransferase involved in cell wall biosynthesis